MVISIRRSLFYIGSFWRNIWGPWPLATAVTAMQRLLGNKSTVSKSSPSFCQDIVWKFPFGGLLSRKFLAVHHGPQMTSDGLSTGSNSNAATSDDFLEKAQQPFQNQVPLFAWTIQRVISMCGISWQNNETGASCAHTVDRGPGPFVKSR